MSWSKIVLFGDSHTQSSFNPKVGYWGALLADKFQRICDVLPRGFSGYNTRYCKLVMKQVFDAIPTNEIACVTILLGSNDSSDPLSPTGQHVPLSEFAQNLADIISYLESVGVSRQRVILMSPPNYFNDRWYQCCVEQKRIIHVKSDDKVREYAKECKKVATEQSVEFLDLYRIFSSHPHSENLFVDGLHFSQEGATLLHEHLSPLIAKKVQDFKSAQSFEDMINFPIWSEIDFNNPGKHFK